MLGLLRVSVVGLVLIVTVAGCPSGEEVADVASGQDASAEPGPDGSQGRDAGKDGPGAHEAGVDAGDDAGGDGDGDGGDGGGPCTELRCRSEVDACEAKGKGLTTITGTVYDPAGVTPLQGVYVYIPNTKPEAIAAGNPSCTQCPAPASGSPVIGALTDANGKFTLQRGTNDAAGVPSGTDIPLVLQVGKWRRQLTIPSVTACTANDLPDPASRTDKVRLPAKTSEGDMPLIAVTTGCDPSECLLRKIGIDDSEFVPPGSATGHVHVFTGQDASSLSGDASKIAGGNTASQTASWWESAANLEKYDLLLLSCECNDFARTAAAEAAMHEYVTHGGRLMTAHYHYNWFAPPGGPSDFQGVASWQLPEGGEEPYSNYYVDSSFPRGKDLADWLQAQSVTTTYGQVPLTDTRYDVNSVNSPTARWVYNANTAGGASATTIMSFNAPIGAAPASQCGRVVYSDAHLAGTSDDSTFPNECISADFDGSHATNQKLIEFMLFDMLSCVQDDTLPQAIPFAK